LDVDDIPQRSFVVLKDERDLLERLLELRKVLPQVLQTLDIGIEGQLLGVRDEDNAVDSFQDELMRRVVKDLTGNGIELETDPYAADYVHFEREQVDKQCPTDSVSRLTISPREPGSVQPWICRRWVVFPQSPGP
jgi:hypothetical protein